MRQLLIFAYKRNIGYEHTCVKNVIYTKNIYTFITVEISILLNKGTNFIFVIESTVMCDCLNIIVS